jgi:hypothetical protein
VDHLVHFKVTDGTHAIVDFVLLAALKRAIHCFIVRSHCAIIVQICVIELVVQHVSHQSCRVKLDPGRGQHKVDVPFQLITPELNHSAQVELTYNFMRLDQGVHVSLETMLSVNRFLIKFDFNETIRVCANDKVDFGPIDHDHFLDVVYYIWELACRQSFQASVKLGRPKVAIQKFLVVQPLCPQKFLFRCLVWIIVHEIGKNVVFLFVFWQETIMILPVVLVHASIEGPVMNCFLLAIPLFASILLMLQKHGIFVWRPFIVAKKSTSSQSRNLRLSLSPYQITILLVIHHFSNGIWQ